jgi:hypothetical protein
MFLFQFVGLADRVIGMVTTCMIAMLTDRAFQVGRRGTLVNLETIFHSPYINWTRESDADWLIEPLKHDAKVRQYNNTVLSSKEYYAVNTINDFKLQDRLLRGDLHALMGGDDVQTTMLMINRGKTIRMFENDHVKSKLQSMGLTPYSAFGCIMHFLIRPQTNLFLPFYQEFYTLTNTRTQHAKGILKIAIQIRAGDTYLTNSDHTIDIHQYRAYFDCADQIEKFVLASGNYTSALWYLVTDSHPLRKAAIVEYGEDKLVTALQTKIEHSSKEGSVCKHANKHDISHGNGNTGGSAAGNNDCQVSVDGFRMAAAEWWMLSFAQYHIISRYSGFGRSAAMYSLQQDHIYTVMNGKGGSSIACSPKTFTDLETLSYDWSGI